MNKLKKPLVLISSCLLVLLICIWGFYPMNTVTKTDHTDWAEMNLSYYEDTSCQLTVDQANTHFTQDGFMKLQTPNLGFGRSRSTFWIRIPTEKPNLLKDYIALFCPNIQNVQLYIPMASGYKVLRSGWANSLIRNDEDLTYPVFRLSQNCSEGKPIYMRIQSCYSHNYMLEFYTQKELKQVRTTDFCLDSFLFGMLIIVVISNIIAFLKLKNKTFLSFSICILLLSIHQGISYGLYNIIMPSHSYVIMSLSIEIGLLFIISIIVFFIIYSDVRIYSKLYYKGLLLCIAACLMDYPISFFDKVSANLCGHCLTVIVPLFILCISFRMHRAGYKDQRLFLFVWGLTVLLYAAVMLESEGMIQITFSTFHLPTELIVMITVSMFFTVSIAERARKLEIESQKIRQRYQVASERVKWTETALMQSQIKPHFLYNTLTAIEQLCETDSQKAQTAIGDFSDFLRSNLDFSTETRLVLIERELSNVKHYLSLEQMRFEERLQIVYDIQAGGFLVPPLVVQPMVENAVQHGVTKRPEGGTITISIRNTPTHHLITVMDNGIGFDPASDTRNDGNHIGIENARERLHRQCEGVLSVESKIGVGTTVTISIPKETDI